MSHWSITQRIIWGEWNHHSNGSLARACISLDFPQRSTRLTLRGRVLLLLVTSELYYQGFRCPWKCGLRKDYKTHPLGLCCVTSHKRFSLGNFQICSVFASGKETGWFLVQEWPLLFKSPLAHSQRNTKFSCADGHPGLDYPQLCTWAGIECAVHFFQS